jgi:hypothetical protein
MLDSIPVPLRALFWPLVGAALILVTRRLLPNWLRRLVAMAAALASLMVLWSLRAGPIERIEVFWEPLNLFRMSPHLYPDSLALLVGITMSWLVAATALGVRGFQPQATAWHGLILLVLAGCLATTMGTNLLTLAMASALLDVAMLALVVFAPHDGNRVAWRMAVPGLFATLLLVIATLQMDAQVGSGSLQARELPLEVLAMVGAAGVLRLLAFPLHPRGLRTPENATALLLSAGAGIYLVTRVQALDSGLVALQWSLLIGSVAMLAGGLLVWTGGACSTLPSESSQQAAVALVWPGTAVQQAGYALAFLVLVGVAVPWPLISLTLALGMLIIWWEGSQQKIAQSGPGWLVQSIQSLWQRAYPGATDRLPAPSRHWTAGLTRYGLAILPALALASIVGVTFTIGSRSRWPFYGELLGKGQPSLLILAIVTDTVLVAGLSSAFGSGLKRGDGRRPSPVALLAMLALAVPLVALGITPGILGLEPVELSGTSVWGLGFVYVLPWLLGLWLARGSVRLASYLEPARRLINLDWLYRAGAWLGRHLAGVVFWVGQLGEGEGWFGWVLIILALGIILLSIR